MRVPTSTRSPARDFVLLAGAIIVTACAPSGPLTQPAGPSTQAPPAARPEPVPALPLPAPPSPTPPETAPRPPAGATCREVEEEFQGQYRAGAKTEYAMQNGTLAPVEYFQDLGALKAFLRPQIDQLMRHRYPHLSDAATDATHRVAEERHNVAVDAYIHAVKHEGGPRGDRDFHIMLGSSPTPGDGIYMTAEASGLPAGGAHRPLLAAARRQLLAILGTCRWGNGFKHVSPIHVRVTGSLFFDGAHGIGSVGPADARPFTVWEIHPILAVERLESGADDSAAPSFPASSDSAAVATGEPTVGTPTAPPEAPTSARPPTARCRDGSPSYAKSHSGACSRHGGVAEWLHQNWG